MTQDKREMSVRPEAVHWKPVGAIIAITALSLGIWQVATVGLSNTVRMVQGSIDEILWGHALRTGSATFDFGAPEPLWRERAGASGDLIIERVGYRSRRADEKSPPVVVLDRVGARKVPHPILVSEAAAASGNPDSPGSITPASFEGLTAGDRITIKTKDGRVYAFEVVTPKDGEADGPESSAQVTIRFSSEQDLEDGADTSSHTIRPVPQRPDGTGLEPQQKL